MNWEDLIPKYVDEKFPDIPSWDWEAAQQQLAEAMKLNICYDILDQLNDTQGEYVRIDIREDVEYDPENYEYTLEICNTFKKYGYVVREENDYDHPVIFMGKKEKVKKE